MGMGKGVKPGLGHGGIICVLQTQFSFFFFGGGGGGREHGNWPFTLREHWKITHYFLENKTNVRECLKIILRNKADHKKNLFCCIPSCPPIFPLPNTFYGTSWK